MKIIAILIILLVVIAGVLGPQFLYVVDETQLAIVTRFGDPIGAHRSPGLFMKAPFLDKVTYFDKRRTLFDAEPDSFLTADKKRLVIDAYAVGRIIDPLQFFKTVRTTQGAERRGKDIVISDLKIEISNDLQEDVIRGSREAIMNKVLISVEPKLLEFGVQVVDVRLKRADFPDQIASSVFANMDAERQRIASAERAEGAKQDLQKRADVDKRATIIRAEAQKLADILRGEGEAEAIRIFAEALNQDPEFYTFQRSLEASKTFLSGSTSFYGSADDLGLWFEQIRKGVVQASRAP